MYSLKDNGIIQEINYGNSFAYVLTNDSQFVDTDYKVLLSQTNDMFIQCTKLTYNGHIGLLYMTDEYRSFSSVVTNINSDLIITIIANLFASILEVRNNGFLTTQNIDVSWDKIFISPNTLKVRLVYIPINVYAYDSYSEFESELRSNLIKLIINSVPDKTRRLDQFLMDLSNGALTLKDLYNRSRGDNTDILSNIQRTEFKPSSVPVQNSMQQSGFYKLVAINPPNGHFEIPLNRESTLIGKKKDSVDAFIPYNNLISRQHCRVDRENGVYYIVDVGSLNGTRLNGFKIPKGQKYQLNPGDIVRLADSDFQVM